MSQSPEPDSPLAGPDGAGAAVDIAIIGGGVNGCGIARDAAGRGLTVALFEKDDLAQATSSASTKLFHGGLRYLEHYAFRLVREALIEREVLIRNMPHISWPLRFVLPHHEGLRPAWLLRLGLFIYDNLGGRKILPGTRSLDLRRDPLGAPLKERFARGFEYSDAWVQDSQLVVLNARDAADRGAEIRTRTRVETAERRGGLWHLSLVDTETGAESTCTAQALVNAAGPWVEEVIHGRLHQDSADRVRLVRGSHVVVPKLYDHDRAYIFQNADGRIIFAIPYEGRFTLLGTTDVEHEGDPGSPECTDAEAAYLCAAASEYFAEEIRPESIVWRYSGVRPLHDDGAKSASKATRDYVLKRSDEGGEAPLLNIFGGKITTYRKLAEAAVEQLRPWFPEMNGDWTDSAPLPGGDFPWDGIGALRTKLLADYPFLAPEAASRLVRAYGTRAWEMLGEAESAEDLGQEFGAGLTAREVGYLMETQWARTAEDVLWRRSKLGLHVGDEGAAALAAHIAAARLAAPAGPA
ncbi:glycerol-3-phosphate dehydrogenase [Paralimibaculum aggregatum]|uniref:Glycerol-3-phosphate dehydrogenase n=1 Tax=Paralimibaculum aggregatum TaxID=3036245 RepID=A0ABQ6LTB1_9RHOB|nr:glycerol-3-phosphate dehydrogenase [Limibaculum sp. NKW23]GMG85312.1 glycerol-3-phosphate dehydrogenase [Limibaculum sp. NKW23]